MKQLLIPLFCLGGQFPQAAACYQQLLQTDPGDLNACNFPGKIRLREGDKAGALQFFCRLAEAKPGVAEYNRLYLAKRRDAVPPNEKSVREFARTRSKQLQNWEQKPKNKKALAGPVRSTDNSAERILGNNSGL